ncbi:hypothetical protein [Roseobacter ponti]|uniref:DUF502 domain-containing protein n=1 Tax=Roseobacter ponti TaxID=1891787 RepID=A0A858SPK1_9RHOB|nr:hypothetical protein [Roseobacter ponti]QJF50769.1 hypothetical protein G3256_06170 [Roseobacter ponti]
MKLTLIGGVLFLAPLAVLAILAAKIFELSKLVAEPLNRMIPIERVIGVALVDIIAIFLILGVCFVAGLLATRGAFAAKMERIDGFLIDAIPGYAVFKGTIGGVAQHEDVGALMTPVMVSFDDYDQIAFRIESSGDTCVVFLPGAPSAWAGSTVIVAADRVRDLNIPVHQAVRLMRVLGRGSLMLEATQGPGTGPPGPD